MKRTIHWVIAVTAATWFGSLDRFLKDYPGKIVTQMMKEGVLKP